jgi:hypothetical protein
MHESAIAKKHQFVIARLILTKTYLTHGSERRKSPKAFLARNFRLTRIAILRRRFLRGLRRTL